MPEQTATTGGEGEVMQPSMSMQRGGRGVYPGRMLPLDNTDELLALARRAAADPAIFEQNPPYFWSAEISSTRTDAYFTKMHPTTLKNFANEASDGRAFLDSHRTDQRPIGYSVRGRFINGGGNGIARVEADFYTMQMPDFPGMPTQQLVSAIRGGIQRDVSVGFYLGEDGEYRCMVCDRDMLNDSECRHIPGFKYPTSDKKAAPLVTATAWIMNAHLAETSGVYDGATPGAAILKAQQESEAGRLRPEAARIIETQYRIALPASHRSWPGTDVRPEEERTMTDDPKVPPETAPAAPPMPPPPVSPLRALMEAAGLAPLESDEHNLRSLTDLVKEIGALKAERERLAVLADDGRAYRTHLIESALKEGVRAYGAEKFPSEQYKAQFEQAPLDFVRTNLTLWTTMGDQVLQPGRQSVDVGEPEPKPGARPFTHPGAFAG